MKPINPSAPISALTAAAIASAALSLPAPQPTHANWGLHKVFDFADGYPSTGADIGVSGTNPTILDDIVMFGISGGGDSGIFRYERGSLISFADNGPGDTFTSVSVSSSNAHNPYGAFTANQGSGNGIYARSINTLNIAFPIATPFTPIPSGTGNFTGFGDNSIDDTRVTFIGNGSSSQRGIYAKEVNSLGDPIKVIERGENLPLSTDSFLSFSDVSHHGNTLVFSGAGSFNSGIYFKTISGMIGSYGTVASTLTAIPDRAVTFTSLIDPSYDGTATAFHGFGPGVSGIYTNQGGSLRTVADTDTPIPNGTGNFTGFGSNSASISGGDIAFEGAGSSSQQGIYIERDGTLEEIVTAGDVVDGRTVSSVSIGRRGFSNGSIAIRLTFDDFGSTFYTAFAEHRWDPPTAAGGNWDDQANWPLGALPAAQVETFIQPDGPAIVQGPTTTTHLRSLNFGSQVTGTTELHLQPTGQLIIAETLSILTNAKLTGNGAVHVDDVLENSGEIDLGNSSLTLSGTQFDNFALLRGNGQVSSKITNFATGEIRVVSGDTIRFTGPTNSNQGQIRLINGGIAEFTGPLTNTTTGTITGRGAIIADGGINNAGAMNFSGGFTDIFGDVVFTTDGTARIGGGGTTTFYDDVINDGTIIVDDGSHSVFFGATSGSGIFPGGGTVVIEGDLSPGHSPGTMDFGGDLSFGPAAGLEIEIGGLLASEFDRLDITGDLSLTGDLTVDLVSGFTLGTGMEFVIAEVDGTLSGTFADLADGALVGIFGGTDLFIDYNAGDGNDVALFTVGLPGDFDADGDVDGLDFLSWQRGESPNSLSQSDLDDWQENYGAVASPMTAASTGVPEPTTGLMLVLGMTTLLFRRHLEAS